MCDPRLNKLAEVLVQYSVGVKKGDLVAISADPHSMPAVEAVFEAVLREGGHPSFRPRSESLQELTLRLGSDEQIQHVCPFETYHFNNCDVLIVLRQPINTRFLGRVNPGKIAMAQAARRERLAAGMKQLAAGKQRYVLTEVPGNASAQDAEMSLTDYADWVYRAGFLHLDDPVGAWRKLHEQQGRMCGYLQNRRVLRFQSPANDGSHGGRQHEGTDLTVDVTGSIWQNGAGDQNFPDGEVFGGPRAVEGVVNFTFPAVFRGKEVDGIRMKFRDGRAVDASATKNEEYLIALLDQDPGARVAGEVGIGTNYQLTFPGRNTFFDEKIGGTFHVALGAGYPQTGNTNESGLHWDIVTDLRRNGTFAGSPGGTIHADGELIQESGRFVFEGWPGE